MVARNAPWSLRYQTRHTFASILLMGGINPAYIAKQLGHATTAMVHKVYAKWIDRADKGAEASRANAVMMGQSSPKAPEPTRLTDFVGKNWRRRRDSNPRYPFEVCRFSKAVPSASRPRLLLRGSGSIACSLRHDNGVNEENVRVNAALRRGG